MSHKNIELLKSEENENNNTRGRRRSITRKELDSVSSILKETLDNMENMDVGMKRFHSSGKLDLRTQLSYAHELVERREKELIQAVEFGQQLVTRVRELMDRNKLLTDTAEEKENEMENQKAELLRRCEELSTENQKLILMCRNIRAEKKQIQSEKDQLQSEIETLKSGTFQTIKKEAVKAEQLKSRIKNLEEELEDYKEELRVSHEAERLAQEQYLEYADGYESEDEDESNDNSSTDDEDKVYESPMSKPSMYNSTPDSKASTSPIIPALSLPSINTNSMALASSRKTARISFQNVDNEGTGSATNRHPLMSARMLSARKAGVGGNLQAITPRRKADADVSSLNSQIGSLKQEIESLKELKNTNAEMSSIITRLKSQNRELLQLLDEKKQDSELATRLKAENQELKGKSGELEEILERTRTKFKAFADNINAGVWAEDVVATSADILGNKKKQSFFDELQQNAEDSGVSYKLFVSSKIAEISELLDSVCGPKDQVYDSTPVIQLQDLHSKLRAKLESLNQDHSITSNNIDTLISLQKKIKQVAIELENSDLQEGHDVIVIIFQLLSLAATLKCTIAELESKAKTFSQFTDQNVQDLVTEKDNLKLQVEKLQSSLEQINQEYSNVDAEKTALCQKIQEMISKSTADRGLLQTKLQLLTDNFENANRQSHECIHQLEDEIDKVKENYANAEQQLVIARLDLEETNKLRDEEILRFDDYKSKADSVIRDLESENISLRSMITGLEAEKGKLSSQLKGLEINVSNASMQNTSLEKDKTDLQQALTRLEGENELLKAELGRMRAQLQALSKDADTEKNNLLNELTKTKRDAELQSSSIEKLLQDEERKKKWEEEQLNSLVSNSFCKEEVEAFSNFVNHKLSLDPDLSGKLPLNPKTMELFKVASDGILLCKLLNACVPGMIDERVINKGDQLKVQEIYENNNLFINTAKAMGCSLSGSSAQLLFEGGAHHVMEAIWQIIKVTYVQPIAASKYPEIVCLLDKKLAVAEVTRMKPKEILVSWFNYHLQRYPNCDCVITASLSQELADSVCYAYLLHQLAETMGHKSDISMHIDELLAHSTSEENSLARAELVVDICRKIGCTVFIKPRDITMGISRLNLFLIAQLFTQHHGLQVLDEAKLEEVTSLTQLDQEATREERAYQFWIQSLGIECTNLCEDVKDGILLIKVIDQIGHNLANTDWKKVNTTFKNHFQKIENCNYALDLSKKLNILSVNIGGKDIMDGNKKLILGFLWQLMRFNILNMLQNLKQGDNEFTEQDMINWANQMVANSGRTSSMGSFKDPALKTGLFLIDLCHACSPNSVNFSTVAPGQTDEECQSNAKYAISLARKIGATIFLLWEDIFEVKPRMIMTFVGSLMSLSSDRSTPSAGNSQPMQSPRTPRFKLPGLSAIAGNSSAEDNHAQSPKPLQTPRRVASSAMLLTPRRGPSGYN